MNPKIKGNEWEREFSYQLSEWLTGEKDSDVCWRDLSSGARSTKRLQNNQKTTINADIMCTNSLYEKFFDLFYIDTKSFQDKSLYLFIGNQNNIKSNKLFKEWLDVLSKCPENKIPLMPVKYRDGRTPNFLILPSSLNFDIDNCMEYQINFQEKEYFFSLVFLEEFFKLNNWEIIYSANKERYK
jgi:hypothetical protein